MLVKTNEWRVLEPCSNCPFLDNGKAMHLNEGRVDDIKEDLRNGGNFTCHKTVYGLRTDMESDEESTQQQPKMCAGAYLYLKKLRIPNTIMNLAKAMGKDN